MLCKREDVRDLGENVRKFEEINSKLNGSGENDPSEYGLRGKGDEEIG